MIKNTCLHNTGYTTLAGSVSEKWSKASNHHAHDSIHNSNVASRGLMGERGPGAGAGWMKKVILYSNGIIGGVCPLWWKC